MTTGPHDTRYQIPDITLGDTFNEWRTVTNDGIIDKLNRMKVYTGTSGDGISVGMKTDGETVIEHSGHVVKGVTFSGPVTFNGAYTIVNAQEFSIDDYIIMLGATGADSTGLSAGGPGASDAVISNVGGGGIQVLRSEGFTASLLWKPDQHGGTGADGVTGTWYVQGPHLGLTRDAWFVSDDDYFRFQTNKQGTSGEGIVVGPDEGTELDNVHNIRIQSTAGTQYELIELGVRSDVGGITNEGYLNLINASTRRRVSKHGHGFSFGMVVRYAPGSGAPDGWTFGIANTLLGAEGVGIVVKTSGNTFDIAYSGEIIGDFRDATSNGNTLSPGNVYHLSDTTPGKIKMGPPSTPNFVDKPVLIALDPIGPQSTGTGDRALVLNYRGALVPNAAADITEQVQNRILIDQVNDFVIGDLVRFEKDLHYGWSGGDSVTGEQEYPQGVWLRGQANTKEEAEVLGIVTQTTVASDSNKFYVTLNGKLDLESGRATEIGITAGRVYFLSANSAPDGRGGEGFSAESLTTNPPLTTGHVKKPWAVSMSTSELIIVNYVGEVIGEESGCSGTGCVLDAGRNLLINGNFDFWQRMDHSENDAATHQAGRSADRFNQNTNDIGGPFPNHSTTTATSQRFFADRWGLWNYGANWNDASTNGGVSRHRFSLSDTSGASGGLDPSKSKPANYYLRITSNLGGAGNPSPGLEQRIEGVDKIYNDKATVSFWARRSDGTAATLAGVVLTLASRASGTGDYVSTSAAGAGGAGYNFEMYPGLNSDALSLNSSWTKYVYTFDVPNIAGVSAGRAASGFGATDWPESGGGAIPGQGWISLTFNPVPSTYVDGSGNYDPGWSGNFDIAQVQFEKGGTETKFDSLSHQDELTRCERYYQKSMGWDGCTGEKDQEANNRTLGFEHRTSWKINNNLPLLGSDNFRIPMRHTPRIQIFDADGIEGNINAGNQNWQTGEGFGDATMRVLNGSVSRNAFGDISVGSASEEYLENQHQAPHYATHKFYWIAEAEI
jgi:hypothetical protein